MLKAVYDIKNTKKNNELANLIKSELSDLKNEIEEMSETEIKTEQPNAIVNVVEKIVDFNNQNQTVQGLKVLTPDQMLSRLPITLAQLQAVNNLEKLKNQIKQLLYSLYRSKKLTEIIYKHLININWKWKQSLLTLKIIRQMSLTNFLITLLTSLILKMQIRILHWLNLAFITNGKNIKSAYNNNEFKISAPTSIPDKIFGTKWSNPVKVGRKRKVWYMF